MLPDIALLNIFDCYLRGSGGIEAWRTLVHVCQEWRNLIFGSPHRLNLRLVCTARRPVREMLEIWPPLPIVIFPYGFSKTSTLAADNIIAALEYNDRVHHVELWEVPRSLLVKALAVMQGPFPVLTVLDLRCDEHEIAPIVPNSFVGGFVPRLRKLSLDRISFPGLPKLLLSATDLVEISLWHIPLSGYIPPAEMVNCLSTLTRLESLWLLFESPLFQPDRDRETRHPRLLTRFILPALTHFHFKGVSNYSEDFVSQIDAPLLDYLDIGFFHHFVFDTPQLVQFVSRTPRLEAYDEAHVTFSNGSVEVTLQPTIDRGIKLEVSCEEPNMQLSSLAQVCSASFPRSLITAVEHLYIREVVYSPPHWQDGIEDSQWLEFLHPFTALKILYLSREIVPRMVPALQHLIGESGTELLPSLQNVCVEGPSLVPATGVIKQFVDAQKLSGHPIAVHDWDGERCMWWL